MLHSDERTRLNCSIVFVIVFVITYTLKERNNVKSHQKFGNHVDICVLCMHASVLLFTPVVALYINCLMHCS